MTPPREPSVGAGVFVVEASQMAEIILNVDVRENTGTGGARAARRSGAVPGILYGGGKAPVAISVNEKDFRKNLYTGRLLGHLITLKYGEERECVNEEEVGRKFLQSEPSRRKSYKFIPPLFASP